MYFKGCERVRKKYHISAVTQNFDEQQKVKTNLSTLLVAVKECCKLKDLQKGKKVHEEVISSGYDTHICIANALVSMYAKCGSLRNARDVFDKMLRHDVVSWTALILGYAQNREGELALQCFLRMRSEGYTPNPRTYVAALKSCTILTVDARKLVRTSCLQKVMAVHSYAVESRCDTDIFVANTLVDMYAKCGNMLQSQKVFDKMTHRDAVAWNTLMVGYTENGEFEVTLETFRHMQDAGCMLNARTFVAVLKACSNLAATEEAKRDCLQKGVDIHRECARRGFDTDIFLTNTLIDFYAKCGSMVRARAVFDKLKHGDVVAWTALISGYAENGEGEMALQLYARMQSEGCASDARTFVAVLNGCTSLLAREEGKQVDLKVLKACCLQKGMIVRSEAAKVGCGDIYLANTYIDLYSKCGDMANAQLVFDKIPVHSVASFNNLILGYAQNGEGDIALRLFARMKSEGFVPDSRSFVAALKAVTNLAAKDEDNGAKEDLLQKGIAIHSDAANRGCMPDAFVTSALVDMYSKCGNMVYAHAVFDKMLQHNVVTWTALMEGYLENQEEEVVLQLFARMQTNGCAPNALTYVAILKACSSVGALETGKKLHSEILKRRLQNDAMVANCLIDFYGKCGSMVNARQVFDAIIKRDFIHWSTLLAGYSRQGDTNHVFNLIDSMRKERVQVTGITFLSVLTACSHAGLVAKGNEYFQAMLPEFGVQPSIEHYRCMIDMLGRNNHLDEALTLVKEMPFEADALTWNTVLGACQKWANVRVGKIAFECLLKLDPANSGYYVAMANIYLSVGMCEENLDAEKMRIEAQAC